MSIATSEKQMQCSLIKQFKAQIVDKFPLALDDSSVIEIAEEMGWSQQWMHPKAKAPRPVVSGDLATLFKAGASRATVPGPAWFPAPVSC